MVFKGIVTYRSEKEGTPISIPDDSLIRTSQEPSAQNPLTMLKINTITNGTEIIEYIYHANSLAEIRSKSGSEVNNKYYAKKPTFKEQLQSIKSGHGRIHEIRVIWEEDQLKTK